MSTDRVPDTRWTLNFDAYDPGDEQRRETLFALGNGTFVTRGAWPGASADDRHYPGTYRAGCYDRLPAEIAGEEVETETLVNLPNWLALHVRIDGGPWLSIDAVEIEEYQHSLDLKRGVTVRDFTFRDDCGRRTRLRETRLVSMAQANLTGLRLKLTPLAWSGRVEIRSALDADVLNSNVERYAPFPRRHLSPPRVEAIGNGVLLRTCTLGTRTEIAQAQRTVVAGAEVLERSTAQDEATVADYVTAQVEDGAALCVEKVVAIATSLDPSLPEPARSAESALRHAPDFAEMESAHEEAWDQLWSRVALDIEREEIARPLRLHAFHILQTASPHSAESDIGLPARGWHGEAYRGHVFWDEIFVFPFLLVRFPQLARALLLYRFRRLDAAREAARRAGCRGAMFPWRSASDGREVTPGYQLNMLSGRWMPDRTHLQHHIGSAVAYNVWQYHLATGDTEFLADHGAEMVLEIARFWATKVQHDPEADRYHIRGVIGPDEYHNGYPGAPEPGLDDNAYTNVMAVWTLCRATEVLDHLPDERRRALTERLELRQDELAEWDRISRRMYVPFHEGGVIAQFEGFDRLRELGPDVIPPRFADARIDWALDAIGQSVDSYQVTKQADVLTLFYLLPAREVTDLLNRLGYSFGPEQFRQTAAYYLDRTAHRSSLSRVVYAGALAEADPALSWEFYRAALDTDLGSLKGESIKEGIHLGAMGGTLDVLQRRYLGLGIGPDGLHLAPALPPELGDVCLRFTVRGVALRAETKDGLLRIHSDPANSAVIALEHSGHRYELQPGRSVPIDATAEASLPIPSRQPVAGVAVRQRR